MPRNAASLATHRRLCPDHCNVRHLSPYHTRRTRRLDRRLLPGDPRPHRLHLSCSSNPLYSDTSLALVSACMVYHTVDVQQPLHSKVDHFHSSSPTLLLAIRQRSHALHHHGRRRHVRHLSRQSPLADTSPKNPSRLRIRLLNPTSRMAPHPARHLQNQSNAYLVSLQHRSRSLNIHSTLLDLRREEANRMGLLRPSRRLQHIADLPAGRLLLLHPRPGRHHILRNASQLWVARSDTIGPLHCIHPRDSRGFYEIEGSAATLSGTTSAKTCQAPKSQISAPIKAICAAK